MGYILLKICMMGALALLPVVALADPVADLLRRVLPHGGDARRFEWRVEPAGENGAAAGQGSAETFTLSCDGRRVHVSGTTTLAVTTGINWYLQHYAGIDISWNSPTAVLPDSLPPCAAERHTASVPWRYYLNFCTHSYSMAFWGWERWQQELDWMALHGVNMPLAIVGMESVWREVLMRDYGYRSLDAVNRFVAGSAYYGWFFMNNLTAWGGPQPRSWYRQREALARRIFRRMKAFGMEPVVPGYVGMVPRGFLAEASPAKVAAWKPEDIVDGGVWCSFTRPAFVDNTARLQESAARYYAAFERLYGDVCDTRFYAIDPFHEGGVPSGVSDAQASVRAMWQALTAYDSAAVWVAQHWQDNPKPLLTHTIPRGRLIILDLHGDQYADVECSGHHTSNSEALPPTGERGEGAPHDWVWGQVSNFGGNVGLFGRMERLIQCFYAARDGAAVNHLVGIGALPEGIENNPVLYDLLFALPWTTTDYTQTTWLRDYVGMRYGLRPDGSDAARRRAYEKLLSAWGRLAATVYNCPNDQQQGTTESVLLMRPSLTPGTVSSWASSTWYWDFGELRAALREFLFVAEVMTMSNGGRRSAAEDNYRYDLVELTRQVLADYGKQLLEEIAAAKGGSASDVASVASPETLSAQELTERFLDLILDQDRLLGTRAELRLGRWTAMARALGRTTAERDLYERNARMILTTWGDRAQCEDGGLHDYANREWQGLLRAYYYPRWRAFFEAGCTPQPWFDRFEWPFATDLRETFSPEPVGDEVSIARELYHKYIER